MCSPLASIISPAEAVRQIADLGDLAADDADIARADPVLIDQMSPFLRIRSKCLRHGSSLSGDGGADRASLRLLVGPIKYELAATQAWNRTWTRAQAFSPTAASIRIAGAEALGFLHRLVTNSLLDPEPGEARYAALLSRRRASCSSISSSCRCPKGRRPAISSIASRSKSPISSRSSRCTSCAPRSTIEDVSDEPRRRGDLGRSRCRANFAGVAFADPRCRRHRASGSSPRRRRLPSRRRRKRPMRRIASALGVPKGGDRFRLWRRFRA